MFQFPGFSLSWAIDSLMDDNALPLSDFSIRIPTDRCVLTAPRGVSPFDASFFSFMWLGIHRTPFSIITLSIAFLDVLSSLCFRVQLLGSIFFWVTVCLTFFLDLSFCFSIQKDHVFISYVFCYLVFKERTASGLCLLAPSKTEQEILFCTSFSLERRWSIPTFP